MNYRTILLDKSFDDELISFLNKLAHEGQPVLGYHYPFYRDMLETIGVGESFYTAVLNENNSFIAFFPGFIKSMEEGTVFSSLPFFGPNAGIICNYENPDCEELHNVLLNFLFKKLEKYNMISFSLYTPFNSDKLFNIYGKLLTDVMCIDKFTNYIDIDTFKLSTSLAYDIRKADKSNVVIKTEIGLNDIDEIYKIYYKNCIDYDIPPKSKMCLEILIKQQHLNPNIKTYLAKIEDKLIGALLMIYSPQIASYYLPCSVHEYRSYQPTTLLINHAINECKERGIKIWNWESSPSKESGVFKFKKKWGSSEGHYKIYIKPYKNPEFYKGMGVNQIQELFPYYFVYPFNQLN